MKLFRGGICALVAFGIAAHGAVESWSAAVIEVGAAVLLVVWATRSVLEREENLDFPALLPPLLGFAGACLVQLLFHRTLYAYATRKELQLLAAYLILVFLAGQVFRTMPHWRGFVWFAMTLGFVTAVFGILQHLTFNGKLYWFREMRYGGIPFGPYVNRNHFAGLMGLLIPVGLAPLLAGKVRRERWLLIGLFSVLPIGALFLTASRGGIVSFLVEVIFLGLLVAFQRSGRKPVLLGGAVLVAAVLLVSWLGVEQAMQRFSSMQPLEVTSSKRNAMVLDSWHIFQDYPLMGSGLGTLQSVFPRYDTMYDAKIVNHAHNDYVEALAETGILGGLFCLWFLWVLLSTGMRRLLWPENAAAALQTGGFIGCIGFLVHSVVDFNLHIPANALLFFLLAYLATSEFQRRP